MEILQLKVRKKDRRRQQILIAARLVFLDKGYGRSTMENVAKEVELSTGTLYLYFKSKEELYASLSIQILQYLLSRLEHVRKKGDTSSDEKLESLKKALLDVYDFDAPLLINMFNLQSSETLHRISLELLTQIKDLARNILSKMTEILKESIKDDAFTSYHPVALADILWGLFSGVILREDGKKIIDARNDFVRSTFELAFEIFIIGLQSPKNDCVQK